MHHDPGVAGVSADHVKNLSASIRQRLYSLARERGETVDQVLTQFALERFLYRLSRSEFRDRFLLKGALLFRVWRERPHRPTRGADFLGFGSQDLAEMEEAFRAICQVPAEDGMAFPPRTVKASELREANDYHGVRVVFMAELGGARIPLQADIGFEDAVVPAPEEADYPALLPLPAPRLWAYPKYAVVAEKFQALVVLGIQNSRMKDFYDLWALSRGFEFEGATLAASLAATFTRRRTPLPAEVPLALTADFAGDGSKNAQWIAFIRRSRLEDAAPALAEVAIELREFLVPPLHAAANGTPFETSWPPAGPWIPREPAAG
ncbi:MAG: nucleotidyl transferase AbiEii/AbiGii toxin family protein [Betaproteobacteria bacterium]|nr:nucleotidyl transferase AbiEii/AbiGii toxin family protein [Betaproteobacteria bacterium]